MANWVPIKIKMFRSKEFPWQNAVFWSITDKALTPKSTATGEFEYFAFKVFHDKSYLFESINISND